jgi:hypothetical protein
MEQYCQFCGNEKTDAADRIGHICRDILTTTMQLPYRFWQECNNRYSKCCGKLATDEDHLFFHGEGWESSYPARPKAKAKQKEWEGFHTTVEMGVSFYADCAKTYFIVDMNNSCDSQEYGSSLAYPADPGDESFWVALDKQLDQAGEAAFDSDILTCQHCGNHYGSDTGPCDCTDE